MIGWRISSCYIIVLGFGVATSIFLGGMGLAATILFGFGVCRSTLVWVCAFPSFWAWSLSTDTPRPLAANGGPSYTAEDRLYHNQIAGLGGGTTDTVT